MLNLPQNTIVNRIVPKNTFFKELETTTAMRRHFTDDIERIVWSNKLAPSTINVDDGDNVHEIVIFTVELKHPDCPNDVFAFIDRNIPRHTVFELSFSDKIKLHVNYKQWSDIQHTKFEIIETFTTDWMDAQNFEFRIDGKNLDCVYDNFVRKIAGERLTFKDAELKNAVMLTQQKASIEKKIEILKNKIRKEPQLKIKMEINDELKRLKNQLNNLK